MPHIPGLTNPNQHGGGVYDRLMTDWAGGTTRTTAMTAIGSKADEYVEPKTILANGATDRFVFHSNQARQIGLAFVGVGADNSETDDITIWGWDCMTWNVNPYQGVTRWVARPLVILTSVTLGARTVAAAVNNDPQSQSGSTWRYADTITIGTDYTFDDTAEVVLGAGADDSFPVLFFDPCGCLIIEIEGSNNGGGTDTTQFMPWFKRV